MPKIVRFHETGAAEVLRLEELPLSEPKAGEVRLRVEAIGLNRAEVMFRQGQYLETPELPARIGYEAAGIIDALGPGVSGLCLGERVSTIPGFAMGRYASTAKAPSCRPRPSPATPPTSLPARGRRSGCPISPPSAPWWSSAGWKRAMRC